MKKVAIGIQARTTSTRLPGKILKNISSAKVIDHVVAQVGASMLYLNKHAESYGVEVALYILVPEADKDIFKGVRLGVGKIKPDFKIIVGPEFDVLTRYVTLMQESNCDYICRITSDCPFVPTPVITKCITVATNTPRAGVRPFGFVTNAAPEYRTFFDGADCEVMSKECVKWLNENAKEVADREHVTQLLYKAKLPDWLRMGHIFTHIDTSKEKYSVDTEEDLESARYNFETVQRKMKTWGERFGSDTVFRF